MTKEKGTLWVIVGATGTGKTEYSLNLAERLKKEKNADPHIVNADSMQFYRGMNIGTAKITESEMRGIPHHFFDVLDVHEEATVAWYQPEARKLIVDQLDNGQDVILVGGSGLYISSIIYDFEFPARDEELRSALNTKFERDGIRPLLKELEDLAPEVYLNIDQKNPRRVIRALEVAKSGSEAPTTLPEKPKLWHEKTKIIGLFVERSELVKRLDERVLKMWEKGLLEEVQRLMPLGLETGVTASRAIGYQQAIQELKGELSTAEAIAKTQSLTRRYARRQVSWFKRYPEIEWVDLSETRIIVAGGEKFLVTTASESAFQSEIPDDVSGIIHAIPTKTLGEEGEEYLLEEPNALWFMDHRDKTGEPVPLSGNGIAAFVRFLLATGNHSLKDRRETVTIATRSGVKDTLVGVVGVSVDLGRWKLLEEGNSHLRIKLGATHHVKTQHETFSADKSKKIEAQAKDKLVVVDAESVQVNDGIGHISVKFFDQKSNTEVHPSGTGSICAAIFTRHFGEAFHLQKPFPNHWKIDTSAGTVAVRMFATEDGEHVSLNVPAEVVEPSSEL